MTHEGCKHALPQSMLLGMGDGGIRMHLNLSQAWLSS